MGRHVQTYSTQGGVAAGLLLRGMGEGRHPSQYEWDLAKWINFEVGYEWRPPRAMDGRVYGGLAVLLDPSDGVPSEPLNAIDANSLRLSVTQLYLYLGVGLGRAF